MWKEGEVEVKDEIKVEFEKREARYDCGALIAS